MGRLAIPEVRDLVAEAAEAEARRHAARRTARPRRPRVHVVQLELPLVYAPDPPGSLGDVEPDHGDAYRDPDALERRHRPGTRVRASR